MKNLYIILFGRFTSMIGNAILGLVLPLLILEKSGNPGAMGNFISITMIPGILFLPFIGLFVEKHNKKWIMVITDFIQFGLYTLLWYYSDKNIFTISFLTIFIMISKVIGETFEVTSSSIFSKIISKELFTKANSLKGILDNGARIITPVFGIFLYKKFGIGFIFLFNALTFLVSGISEIFITYTHTKVSSLEELKIEKVLDSSTSIEEKSKLKVALDKIIKITGIHNYKDVFKFILNDKILTNFMIFIVLANFILAPLGSTLFPFVALKRVGISEYQYSIANTMSVIASILASSLLLYKKREPDIRGLIIKNSFVFLSIGLFGGLAARFNIVTPYFYLYSLLYFLMGGIGTLINIPLMSTLQKLLPPEMQGRFFAVLSFIGGLLVPLGITIFSNIANYILAEYIIVVNSLVLLFIISRLDFDIHKGEKVV